jgi:ATP-dependent RNA helicase DDX27
VITRADAERLLCSPCSVRSAPATRVVVITPTRELAVQIAQMGERLAQFTDIRIALVVGGLSLAVQAAQLRTRPEVVVATPGRLIDHLRNTQSFGAPGCGWLRSAALAHMHSSSLASPQFV